ncbi:hypothetical protein ACFWB2_10755 [Streptomyces virginiae]|uniref:hypothetical protein n=1 Tax=Streptomyces virginiae TaxID=1961 RepID=UPI00367F8B08
MTPTWTTTGVFTGAGGVRTDEAGIITGEVSVRTIWKDGQAHIAVQYGGAPHRAGAAATARGIYPES